MRRSRVSVIDLFSGAGGLALGAEMAGAEVRLSVELDPTACETLRRNQHYHRGDVLEADISTLTGMQLRRKAGLLRGDPLIVVGGPPCQPFSKAAYWTDPGDESRFRQARAKGLTAVRPTEAVKAKPDERRSLVEEFLRLIVESRAQGFVFENVPSILHPRHRVIFENFRSQAEDAGYSTELVHANAVNYGVAQRRNRVVLLGLRGKHAPSHPTATHHAGPELKDGLLPCSRAGDVLRPFASAKFAEPEEAVAGRWEKHLKEIPPGWNYKALTSWAGHANPTFVAETRFWNFLLKLNPELPSWTIAANPGPWTGPFHWDSRRLRTCEMAALQSFPADYIFAGNRRDRVRQIGNAVPPLMARQIVEPLVEAISGSTRERAA